MSVKLKTPELAVLQLGGFVFAAHRLLWHADLLLVDEGVAVIVNVVTDLGGLWVDGGVGVVAVADVLRVVRGLCSRATGSGVGVAAPAIAILVEGGVVIRETLVHHPIAVIVDAVTSFRSPGKISWVVVVAVGVVSDIAAGLVAGGGGACGAVGALAVPITVGVRVPGGAGTEIEVGIGIVDEAVTIVVDIVADLGGSRVDGGVGVVTVLVVGVAVAIVVGGGRRCHPRVEGFGVGGAVDGTLVGAGGTDQKRKQKNQNLHDFSTSSANAPSSC